jgi:signal peptidase I
MGNCLHAGKILLPIHGANMRQVLNKNSKYICLSYLCLSFLSHQLLSEHQDGRIAAVWILFIILATVRLLEEFANIYFKNRRAFYIKLGFVIFVLSFFYYILTGPFQLYVCETPSMAPTINPRNIVIVNRMAYHSKQPQKNDLVLMELNFGSIPAIHRIIACPNDVVRIENGVVSVNKKESMFNSIDSTKPKTVILSEDTYYQKGDSPNAYFDIVHSDQILGKAIYVFGGKQKTTNKH